MAPSRAKTPPRRPPRATRVDVALWVAVAAALGVRALLLVQVHGHPLLRPTGVLDDAEYLRLAQRAAGGDWALGPGAYYVSPLYIYFLAAIFRLLGATPLHAQAVQVLLGAAAVGLVGLCARRLVGPRAGAFAAWLAALTGVLAFNEVLLLQSALDPFLAALGLERLSAALARPAAVRFAAAGAALGLLGLNRPNALAALALVAAVLLVTSRTRRVAGHALALGAGAALALAPVAVRNRVVTGEWILVASHGGLNFYIGNNPAADGVYQSPPGVTPTIQGQAADTRRVAEQATGRRLTDSEVSDYYYGEGWSWIRGSPAAAARLFLRKLVLTFHSAELPLNYSYAYWSRDEPTVLRYLVVGPWILVPLGLAGLCVTPTIERRAFFAWAAFIPAYAVAVALFFVASRYRLPLVVALTITSGAALEWLARALASRQATGWRRVASAALAGAVFAYWPWTLDEGLGDERGERVVHLIVEGRGDEAHTLLARTLPIHRDPGLLQYRVGRAWLDAGGPEQAIAAFEAALAVSPEQGEVHHALGQALLRLRRPAESIPHIEKARTSGVFLDVAGLELARAHLALSRPETARAVVAATPLLHDTDAVTATALGVLAVTVQDPATALRFLDYALARDPNVAATHEHRGIALEQLGHRAEAIQSLETAIRLDPSDASACFNLALLYAREGRLADARRLAERSLALDPSSRHTQQLLADLHP